MIARAPNLSARAHLEEERLAILQTIGAWFWHFATRIGSFFEQVVEQRLDRVELGELARIARPAKI